MRGFTQRIARKVNTAQFDACRGMVRICREQTSQVRRRLLEKAPFDESARELKTRRIGFAPGEFRRLLKMTDGNVRLILQFEQSSQVKPAEITSVARDGV